MKFEYKDEDIHIMRVITQNYQLVKFPFSNKLEFRLHATYSETLNYLQELSRLQLGPVSFFSDTHLFSYIHLF